MTGHEFERSIRRLGRKRGVRVGMMGSGLVTIEKVRVIQYGEAKR